MSDPIKCPKCGEIFSGCSQIDVMVLDGDDRCFRTYYCYNCKQQYNGMEVEPDPPKVKHEE